MREQINIIYCFLVLSNVHLAITVSMSSAGCKFSSGLTHEHIHKYYTYLSAIIIYRSFNCLKEKTKVIFWENVRQRNGAREKKKTKVKEKHIERAIINFIYIISSTEMNLSGFGTTIIRRKFSVRSVGWSVCWFSFGYDAVNKIRFLW